MNPQQTIFDTLSKSGFDVPADFKEHLAKKIDELISYQPSVGILGKTGVGKSSLCNALFGKDVCATSDVTSCTRDPKEVFIPFTEKGINLVDLPGVGESGDRDTEYAELYHKKLPELDVVLWVLKGDDRAFSSDESFYTQVVKPHIDQGKAFFVVLNQVDKIEPFREWDTSASRPGSQQASNIENKRKAVASFFNLPLSSVIPVSAREKYGLTNLLDAIVFALPKDKKWTFIERVPLNNRTKEAIDDAEKGLLDTVSEWLKGAGDVIKALGSLVVGIKILWGEWRK